MSIIYIDVQNYGETTGVELSAPSNDTNVADHLEVLIELNSFTGDDISDLLISLPTTLDGFNLTSMGKIDLSDDMSFDSTLWRMRNGDSPDMDVNLRGYQSPFSVNYRQIRENYDTFVISPRFEGSATHILTNRDALPDIVEVVKASSNDTATGYDLSATTDDYHITGTNYNDTLTGAGGNDTLSGGRESDFLTGGLGSDELNLGNVDEAVDSVFYDDATITDAASKADAINEFEVGTDKIVLGGNLDFADTLVTPGGTGTIKFAYLGGPTLIYDDLFENSIALVNEAKLTVDDFLIV